MRKLINMSISLWLPHTYNFVYFSIRVY
uniref:Uncharacterized protein n=1 Tax=Anguilla anguilla TaxID=7936 RepID=A0A0E9VFL9_ANGAN